MTRREMNTLQPPLSLWQPDASQTGFVYVLYAVVIRCAKVWLGIDMQSQAHGYLDRKIPWAAFLQMTWVSVKHWLCWQLLSRRWKTRGSCQDPAWAYTLMVSVPLCTPELP
jgi:hypothetical protein